MYERVTLKALTARPAACSVLRTNARLGSRTKLPIAFLIFVVSYSVKSPHAVDLAPVMDTTDQPLWGMVMDYDARALGIARGRGVLIPNDAHRPTPLSSRPPGYTVFVGIIYAVFGRNLFTEQLGAIQEVTARSRRPCQFCRLISGVRRRDRVLQYTPESM